VEGALRDAYVLLVLVLDSAHEKLSYSSANKRLVEYEYEYRCAEYEYE